MKTHPLTLLAAVGFLAVLPPPGGAQEAPKAVTLMAGPSQYDLSGTGTTGFVAARVDLPLGAHVVVEPGFAYLPYETQGDVRRHHLLPEVQLQGQYPGTTFRPYLGAGVGASVALSSRADETDLTLSSAAGFRIVSSSGWLLRGELRVRVIEPWVGTTGDWALGVGRTF